VPTAPARIAAFGYHEVSDDPATTGFQRPGAIPYTLSCATWERHLAALAAVGRAPVLITTIDPAAPGDHLVLTFDDGGRSARHVGDTLAARGWPGHFFIVTSLLGSRTFLDPADLRALRAQGHEVGTHSDTHPGIFRELPAARMVEEWRVSADRLAQLLGEPCRSASVPGGDVSPAVFRSADEAGLGFLFTSEPWITARRHGNCWLLGRYVAKRATPPGRVAQLARFRGWGRALLVRRLKNAARVAAPGLYRSLVRRRTRAARFNGPS